MKKSNFLSFILGIMAVGGLSAFALSSQYLKSDGTPNFQGLKSTANGNQLKDKMRDDLMDGLSKMQNQLEIQQKRGSDIPAGAVMAFNLESCPEGWTRFAEADGRFIMGSEGGYSYNGSLPAKNIGAKGGAKDIQLRIDQLPKHSFKLFSSKKTKDRGYDHKGKNYKHNSVTRENNHDEGDDNYSYTIAADPNNQEPIYGRTNTLGNNNSINIQNPYIKLLYCQKN